MFQTVSARVCNLLKQIWFKASLIDHQKCFFNALLLPHCTIVRYNIIYLSVLQYRTSKVHSAEEYMHLYTCTFVLVLAPAYCFVLFTAVF